MAIVTRSRFTWQLRTSALPLGRRTLVMGILNVTPDSFSDGGQSGSVGQCVDRALAMLDEGADLLDIGGESTRPNAAPVSAAEEQERILPVVRALRRARPDTIVSVDTYHAATAKCALDEGVEIINDVSGLLWDPAMAELLADEKPGAVLMHTRGVPQEWTALPPLRRTEILPLVESGLTHSLRLAEEAGIELERVVLDPGFGFGKAGHENYVLLAQFQTLRKFDLPLLAGISRKRFLTAQLPQASDQARLHATTAANVAAVLAGAHLLRVHDVAAARAAASVADCLVDSLEFD